MTVTSDHPRTPSPAEQLAQLQARRADAARSHPDLVAAARDAEAAFVDGSGTAAALSAAQGAVAASEAGLRAIDARIAPLQSALDAEAAAQRAAAERAERLRRLTVAAETCAGALAQLDGIRAPAVAALNDALARYAQQKQVAMQAQRQFLSLIDEFASVPASRPRPGHRTEIDPAITAQLVATLRRQGVDLSALPVDLGGWGTEFLARLLNVHQIQRIAHEPGGHGGAAFDMVVASVVPVVG